MRIGVIGENICDINSVKTIIESVLGSIAVEKRPSKGPVIWKLKVRIQGLIDTYKDLISIIIIRDLDNKNCRRELKIIEEEITDFNKDLIIIQFVIQEIEAWYLAMPEAIEKAFPKLKPFPHPKGLTDTIKDSKAELRKRFKSAYQKRIYHETTDGPKIAGRFDYNKNIEYPNKSFMRFLSKIRKI